MGKKTDIAVFCYRAVEGERDEGCHCCSDCQQVKVAKEMENY